jgi:cytochrome c oxidase assembly protein subunit 15
VATLAAMSRTTPMVARLRQRPGPRTVRAALLASVAGLWVIVPSGAAVRLTASGLGCPDWPLCEGNQVIPETSAHAAIEGSNRVLSALVVIVAVIAWLIAMRAPSAGRALRVFAGIAAFGSIGQVPLGAITVLLDLHPVAVGAHFLLSMVALAAGVVAALIATDDVAGRRRKLSRARAPLAALAVVAGASTLVTGMLVTAAGPHSGDREVVERFGDLSDAAYVHVRSAIVFVVLAAVLVAWVLRDPRSGALTKGLGIALVPALVVQIGLGEYQWRNGLPVEVVGAHVSLGALVWGLVVATAVAAALPEEAPQHAPPTTEAMGERAPAAA